MSDTKIKLDKFNDEADDYPLYRASLLSAIEGLGEYYVQAINEIGKFEDAKFEPTHFMEDGKRLEDDPQALYNHICRKIHHVIFASTGKEVRRKLCNYGVVQGDGISLLQALDKEHGGTKC